MPNNLNILIMAALIASGGIVSGADEPRPLDIFVLTGQSNAQGCIEDGEAISLEAQEMDGRILFYWSLRNARGEKVLCTSKGKTAHLQTQFFDDGSGLGHWGIEVSCFRKLYSAGMHDILIIKATRGGGGNNFWFKDSPDHHMYDAVVTTVREALAELEKTGRKFEFKGLLYIQGESDGKSASIAGERAKMLLENLRSEFPNTRKMQMFIGGIAGFGPERDITRAKHKEIAEKNPDIHFIDTSDLLKTHQYKDKLHFNNAARIIIGERFADEIIKSNTEVSHD